MKRPTLQKTWRILKKIFLWVFIVHTGWFLIFLIQKFSVSDFTITHLKEKVLIVCGSLVIIGAVYYLWLRKIPVIKKVGIVVRETFFICYISSFIYLIMGMVFSPPITITQLTNMRYGLKRDCISYSEMGPNIKLAVMASEDQNYPDHDGFDLKAIKRAIKYNKRHPNRVRGASTISQQTAKNVFLWQGGGFFTIDQCVMRRIKSGEIERSMTFQPHLSAECELSWLTAKPATSAEKKG